MNNAMFNIKVENAISEGRLTYPQIAEKYKLTIQEVMDYVDDLNDRIENTDEGYNSFDYSDDEDALASAGWGVDESYVIDNDYFD
jgi:translation elongation factor EF-4